MKTGKKRCEGVLCAAVAGTGSLMEEYRMLRIEPGASEKEVKKAFRRLALQVFGSFGFVLGWDLIKSICGSLMFGWVKLVFSLRF